MSGASIHSLGMTVAAVAAAVTALTVAIGLRREKTALLRLRGALGARRRRAVPGSGRWSPVAALREWGPAAVVCLGAVAVIGGALGGLVGVIMAHGIRKGLKGRQTATDGLLVASPADVVTEAAGSGGSGAAGFDDLDAAAGLPLCVDLMAACLAAGASPGEAAGAVGRSLGGPLGTALIRAQAELRFGADPAQCWQRLGRLPAAREMGRCLARASMTGAAPVAEMSRLAADHRARRARAALGRARRAAVLATAPLGLCFLPAFLLVGVAPVVIGLAGTVLGGRTG